MKSLRKIVLIGLLALPFSSFEQVKVEILDAFSAAELTSSDTEKAEHVTEKPKEGAKYLVVVGNFSSTSGEDGRVDEEKIKVTSGSESYPLVASYNVDEAEVNRGGSDLRYDEDVDLQSMVFMVPNAAADFSLQLDAQTIALGKIGTSCKLASEKYAGKILESALITSAEESGYYSWDDREGTTYTKTKKALRGKMLKVKVSMTVEQYAYAETSANFIDRGFVLYTDKNVAINSLGASRDGNEVQQNFNYNCYKKDAKAVEFYVFFGIGDLKIADLKGHEVVYKGTSIGKM